MKYDCIVIGGGIAGLVSALTLQKNGKKVLILEQKNILGGMNTSFLRGRFEFDANIFPFYGFGKILDGEGNELFKRLGIFGKVQIENQNELFHLIHTEMKEEFTFPVGIEEFIQKMEDYVPGSKASMISFFGLCEDVLEDLRYLEEHPKEMEEKEFYQKFPNFVQLSFCKVQTVLDYMKMPATVVELLASFCSDLGSSFKDLNFLYFARYFYDVVKYGYVTLKSTSRELTLALESAFLEQGGQIFCHEMVDQILIEDGKVKGVRVKNHKYFADDIIANVSPKVVYGKMISKDQVPIVNCQLENERVLGPRPIVVYLGLNENTKKIGLSHDTYLIENTLNSYKEYQKMFDVFSGHLTAKVMKKNEDSTIFVLYGLVMQDGFDKLLKKENYFDLKENLEEYYVSLFEKTTRIKLHPYIEEITIATPLTYAYYTGHPDGAIYGYLAKGYDNYLCRLFSEEDENQIEGLYFCGSFGTNLSLNLDVLKDGERIANKVLKG